MVKKVSFGKRDFTKSSGSSTFSKASKSSKREGFDATSWREGSSKKSFGSSKKGKSDLSAQEKTLKRQEAQKRNNKNKVLNALNAESVSKKDGVKLHKLLANVGVGSRRSLEALIEEGRVEVNGQIVKLGFRAIDEDITVKIDGKVVYSPKMRKIENRCLMYYKPEGEICSLSDPQNRPTVFDHLPRLPIGKWINVGRLDLNTSGLLLFTTDGDLAHALMHPRFGIERVYAVRIYGEVTDEHIDKLLEGVMLEDGLGKFDSIEYYGGKKRNSWFLVSLREGRNREVRRLWECVGLQVSRLIRISYAGLNLDPTMKSGQCRELTLAEVNQLRSKAQLDPLRPDEFASVPLHFSASQNKERRNVGSKKPLDKDDALESDGIFNKKNHKVWGKDSKEEKPKRERKFKDLDSRGFKDTKGKFEKKRSDKNRSRGKSAAFSYSSKGNGKFK